jgi:hypothetical protein
MVARRLDQLHNSLDALGDRLRRAVADAVAESLGGWIRDAFLTTLDRLAGRPSDPAPWSPPRRRWGEPQERDRLDERDERELWHDEAGWDEEPEPGDEPPPQPVHPPPGRFDLSLAAGLQAAAWWVRSAARGRPLLTTLAILAIASLVSLAAFAVPAVTTAAFGLVASAGQLLVLSTFGSA